jgi:hypothetical protein
MRSWAREFPVLADIHPIHQSRLPNANLYKERWLFSGQRSVRVAIIGRDQEWRAANSSDDNIRWPLMLALSYLFAWQIKHVWHPVQQLRVGFERQWLAAPDAEIPAWRIVGSAVPTTGRIRVFGHGSLLSSPTILEIQCSNEAMFVSAGVSMA